MSIAFGYEVLCTFRIDSWHHTGSDTEGEVYEVICHNLQTRWYIEDSMVARFRNHVW